MSLLLPLLTAIGAGALHALEPDHMAAVSTFVARDPHPSRALSFGLRWGLGHSAAALVLGGTLVLLDLRVPTAAVSGLEFGVGAMLFGLGIWLLWRLLHAEAHRHGPPAPAADAGALPHTHGTFWVGLAHGLAGTAPLLGILPVTLLPSAGLAFGYLALYGVGTVAGMGLFALAAGIAFRRAGRRGTGLGRALRISTGLGSAALGVGWMAASLG